MTRSSATENGEPERTIAKEAHLTAAVRAVARARQEGDAGHMSEDAAPATAQTAAAEAGRLVDEARREAFSIYTSAREDAQAVIRQARDEAEAILSQARAEATTIALQHRPDEEEAPQQDGTGSWLKQGARLEQAEEDKPAVPNPTPTSPPKVHWDDILSRADEAKTGDVPDENASPFDEPDHVSRYAVHAGEIPRLGEDAGREAVAMANSLRNLFTAKSTG